MFRTRMAKSQACFLKCLVLSGFSWDFQISHSQVVCFKWAKSAQNLWLINWGLLWTLSIPNPNYPPPQKKQRILLLRLHLLCGGPEVMKWFATQDWCILASLTYFKFRTDVIRTEIQWVSIQVWLWKIWAGQIARRWLWNGLIFIFSISWNANKHKCTHTGSILVCHFVYLSILLYIFWHLCLCFTEHLCLYYAPPSLSMYAFLCLSPEYLYVFPLNMSVSRWQHPCACYKLLYLFVCFSVFVYACFSEQLCISFWTSVSACTPAVLVDRPWSPFSSFSTM